METETHRSNRYIYRNSPESRVMSWPTLSAGLSWLSLSSFPVILYLGSGSEWMLDVDERLVLLGFDLLLEMPTNLIVT